MDKINLHDVLYYLKQPTPKDKQNMYALNNQRGIRYARWWKRTQTHHCEQRILKNIDGQIFVLLKLQQGSSIFVSPRTKQRCGTDRAECKTRPPTMAPMLKESRTNATCWTTSVPTTCSYKHRWSTPCSLKLPQGSSMRVRQTNQNK